MDVEMNSRERFLEPFDMELRPGAVFRRRHPAAMLYGFGAAGFEEQARSEDMFRIPAIFDRGFNCLWAYEADSHTMDCRGFAAGVQPEPAADRRIDLDVLRQGKDAIRFGGRAKVPPLLSEGGYIPCSTARARGYPI